VVTTRSVVAVLVVGAAGLAAAAFTASNSTPGTGARGASPSVASSSTHAAPRHTHAHAAPSRSRPAPFGLVLTMRSGRIATDVVPINVASNEPVDPPHGTAREWNTAVWVEQSTYPSTPARGTTYVYGHACHYHVCPFTNLKDARVGDHLHATTAARASTYTIERIGLSPNTASSLPAWASDSTVPNRIVLITCAYEQDDTSTANIVVVTRLDH
jgi:hypothetical protein